MEQNNFDRNLFLRLQDISHEELMYLNNTTKSLTDHELKDFYLLYQGKRKKSQEILLLSLVGFLGIAGIHRFMLGQVGMGIVYFLTCGFCFIGTIVDLVNHKSMTNDYNETVINECLMMVKRR